LNPNQLLNNCVSVTITKILAFRNVHEFWHTILGGDLPDTPLGISQIIKLLNLTGWDFTWKIYQACDKKSAHHHLKLDVFDQPRLGNFRALVYTRDGGAGHCVVSGAAAEMESSYEFACYQQETYGRNVLHEVQAAEKLFMIFLRCPRDTPQWIKWQDRYFWRMVERRSDPVWKAKRLESMNSALEAIGLKPLEAWPEDTILRIGSVEIPSSYGYLYVLLKYFMKS
jgi:hypothetical protein